MIKREEITTHEEDKNPPKENQKSKKIRNQRKLEAKLGTLMEHPPTNLYEDLTKKSLQKLPLHEPKRCKERHSIPRRSIFIVRPQKVLAFLSFRTSHKMPKQAYPQRILEVEQSMGVLGLLVFFYIII